MPGVPDFYQGTEFWDLSLVDPDNRRPVDFDARAAALAALDDNPDWAALARDWASGRIKLALIRRLLAIRHRFADVFADGTYHPVEVTGPHAGEIIAFRRTNGRDSIVVVAGHLFGRATNRGRTWPSGEAWAQTMVAAENLSGWRSLIGDTGPMQTEQLSVAQLFSHVPVAILHAESVKARKSRALAGAT
jgi:(1->4)-alpha-D-glucan 1-alpha-D-glucosylmutase